MPNATTALRLPVSHPQSNRPAHVQILARAPALTKATELAFLRFETPNLDAAERVRIDFGMQTAARTADQIVMRGAGSSPCLYVATRARAARYAGAAFVVPPNTDLQRLVRESGARTLEPQSITGGGRGVELIDPAGHTLWLLTDRPQLAAPPVRDPLYAGINTVEHKARARVRVPAVGLGPAVPGA